MGKWMPSTQMFNLLMGTLYSQFTEKDINTFEDFHHAFLDIFNTVNSALPGRHYDGPSRKEVEECYHAWERSNRSDRKRVFVELVKKTMTLSRLDDATLMTGIVTPPAAMAAKKAGGNVPQMSIIKAIPDVIFVPSVTLIALITAKLSRKIIQRKKASIPEPEASSPAVLPSHAPVVTPEYSAPPPVEVQNRLRDTPREPPTPSPQTPSSHQSTVPEAPPPGELPTPGRVVTPEQSASPPVKVQNWSSDTPRESPLASPRPLSPPPSTQIWPIVPPGGSTRKWYSPTPQPYIPRTRQPQPQYSSAPRS